MNWCCVAGTYQRSAACLAAASGYTNSGNLMRDFGSASYPESLPLSLFSSIQSYLIGAGNSSLHADVDFNGNDLTTDSMDIGAYKWSVTGNSDRVFAETFERLNTTNPNTGNGGPTVLPSLMLLLMQ